MVTNIEHSGNLGGFLETVGARRFHIASPKHFLNFTFIFIEIKRYTRSHYESEIRGGYNTLPLLGSKVL